MSIDLVYFLFLYNAQNMYFYSGTYEKVEEEEEEIYEVINVHKLKSATPNLRVINLYGINFIDDSHIDAFSSNCIQVCLLCFNRLNLEVWLELICTVYHKF